MSLPAWAFWPLFVLACVIVALQRGLARLGRLFR